MISPEIVMYARERPCPDVNRSRDFLRSLGLDWTEYDIETDTRAATKVEELTGRRRVPTVVIGDAVLVEPSNEELGLALSEAGFEAALQSRSN